jgi:hypothetical protein
MHRLAKNRGLRIYRGAVRRWQMRPVIHAALALAAFITLMVVHGKLPHANPGPFRGAVVPDLIMLSISGFMTWVLAVLGFPTVARVWAWWCTFVLLMGTCALLLMPATVGAGGITLLDYTWGIAGLISTVAMTCFMIGLEG